MIKTVQSKIIPALILIMILLAVVPQLAEDQSPGDIGSPDSLAMLADSIALGDTILVDSIAIEDTIRIDSIYYTADSIYYYVQEERIMLSGNAFLRYQDATIGSDTIMVDMKEQVAASMGQALMKQDSHQLLGDEIHFDIEKQTGLISQGATKFDKGYYYGKEVRKVGKEVFDIDKGYFTTCDSKEPHYFIYSRDMRLYKDDKIVAKPVIFYVNHFPVLALPYATFTIKRGRKSGFLVAEPGYNSHDGKYLKNIAYFIAISDYTDVTTTLDYLEKTGWESRVEGRYKKQYDFDGDYIARLHKYNGNLSTSDRYEWYVRSTHSHNTGYNSTFNSNLEFVSNKNLWAGDDDINDRLKEKLSSTIAYKTPLFERNLYVNASYTDDLTEDTKSLVLPSVSYSLPSKPVYELFIGNEDLEEMSEDDDDEDKWWEALSYSYTFKGVHTGTIEEEDPDFDHIFWLSHRDSTGTYLSEHHAGILNTGGLTYSWKTLGWLNLSQSLSAKAVVIDRDKDNNKAATGYDYSTTTRASFSLYGVKQMPGMYVSGVRHIATPSISFTYKPDFEENADLYSFGGVGVNSGKKSRTINYGLDNTWQLKLRGDGEKGETKLNDFLSLKSRLTYNLDSEGKGFGNISHTLGFKPAKTELGLFGFTWSNSGSITEDAYDFDISNWSVNTSFAISGEASYTDYFPEPLNRFETSTFFLEDSLETEEESTKRLDTIDKIEQLADTENWKVTATHQYSQNRYSKYYKSNLRINTSFRVTTNWTISYDNYIDLKESEFISHELTITRMLHCWKLTFKWTKSGDYWDYRLTLFAIKLPDALKFRTSDHKH